MAHRATKPARTLSSSCFLSDPPHTLSTIVLCFACLAFMIPGASLPLGSDITSLVSAGVLLRIPPAKKIIEEERRRTRAERDAFQAFHNRISDIEAQPHHSERADGGPPLQTQTLVNQGGRSKPPGPGPLETFRPIYQETIMAVDHYDEEYAEPFQENFAQEFGTEVFKLLASKSVLDSGLKRTLLEATRESKTKRETFIQALEHEVEALNSAEDRLSRHHDTLVSIQNSIGAGQPRVATDWDELCSLEDACSSIIECRQKYLQSSYQGLDAMDLQSYLYQDREWTYPILDDATTMVREIQSTKDRLFRSIRQTV